MHARSTLALFLSSGFALPASLSAAELPLNSITLYRSGVGYFERAGNVSGDETIRLRFEVDRVNDILKSMVLLDLDGGRVGGAAYMPNEPLERRLAGFRINPLHAGSVMELMKQLRGSEVRIKTAGGEIRGVVLGVEKRPTPIGSPGAERIVDDAAVSLITKSGVTTIAQADFRSFDILDEALAAELSQALTTLAEFRDDRWTDLDLSFTGKGKRRVVVAYTHAAPVWKTSYRLILPDESETPPTLQGWAIVENDTEADWRDVHLSLASGRPVSFIMDLQTPLMLDRPNIPVPVIASLPPSVYELGSYPPVVGMAEITSTQTPPARESRHLDFGLVSEFAPKPAALASGISNTDSETLAQLQAAASASDVGEQFLYTIDAPVSIDRGGSVMLPIISGPIEGRRMTIYSAQNADPRPMLGVELTNSTGLHLMPGPIAVFDTGAYAGDAEIQHLARGRQRMLSYAVDHDLDVSREIKSVNNMRKLRITSGMIERTHSSRRSTTYTLTNNDTNGRIVLLEHPKQTDWQIIGEQTPDAETETIYRFESIVGPGETKPVIVEIERIWSQMVSTESITSEELLSYQQAGKVSDAVVSAVTRAGALRATINARQAVINRLLSERMLITGDQSRIRENMRTIDRQSELYSRYMNTFAAQETRLEDIQNEQGVLQREMDAARAELQEFLKNLNIE